MEYAIIFALILVIGIMQILHSAERKDLYNRIMAKNYSEYKIKHEDRKISPIRSIIYTNAERRKKESDR